MTVLMAALENLKDSRTIEILMRPDLDMNTIDKNGNSHLIFAIMKHRSAIAVLMLEKGKELYQFSTIQILKP